MLRCLNLVRYSLLYLSKICAISENILLELSTFFQSIRISQLYLPNSRKNIPYFFGLHYFDWSSIILEMFSGKMDKLYICNFHYPQYLSAKSAGELLEVRK